jgi:rieske iron-sulfur protein
VGSNACRRMFLKSGVGLGVALALSPCVAADQEEQASSRPKEDDLLVKDGDTSLKPLAPEDIPLNSTPVIAWVVDPASKVVRKGSHLNLLLLMRFEQAALAPATRSVAAAGVVAYSALCTHAGCDLTEWMADRGVLSCDCHGASFDPKNGAKVVEGPATRPLSALPLKLVDGTLVVAQPFMAPITFDGA